MMRSRWSKWLSGVGAVVLIGGLVLANYGAGVSPAEAHRDYKNPFKQILGKLNLILDGLNDLKAGGGGAPSPSPGGGTGSQSRSWDTHNQSAAVRFTVLTDFGSAAVRDNNTGLVWEQSPDATTPPTRNWNVAALYCLNQNVGGTKGWRLPSIPELASLIDPSTISPSFLGPTLTLGHPFSNVTGANYWSATTSAHPNPTSISHFTTTSSLVVNFQEGSVETIGKGSTAHVWCVRGPMTESVY